MKKSTRYAIGLIFVGFAINSIAVEPQPGDYRPTGESFGKGVKAISEALQSAALSKKASQEKDILKSNIENSLNTNGQQGVLVKVVVDKHPATGIKEVRSVFVVGVGESPRSVLKKYYEQDQLSAGPKDGFFYDIDSSKLAWFKKENGEVKEYSVMLTSQLEESVITEIKTERETARIKAEEARKAQAIEAAQKTIEQQRKAEAQRNQIEEARRMAEQVEAARRAAEQAEAARRAAEAAKRPPVVVPKSPPRLP